jgi:fatty-acyl-CoA synthase
LSAGPFNLSWGQLEQQSGRIAVALQAAGVTVAARVGILGANSLAWCLTALATLRMGAVVVPLNPRLPPDELAYLVDLVGASAVALDGAAADRYRGVFDVRTGIATIALQDGMNTGASIDRTRVGPGGVSTCHAAPGDAALISFTSGTSGRPKGVTLTHDNIRAMAETFSRCEDWGRSTVSLCHTSLFFNGSVTNTFLGTMVVGGRFILEKFDPVRALQRISADRVTCMTGVPLAYASIATLPEFETTDLSSVRSAITGGAPIDDALLATWAAKGVRLRQAYGLTEATGPVTIIPPEQYAEKSRTVGIPVPGHRIVLVDDDDREVPPGTAGEVTVSGPQVMAAYWADPAATATALAGGRLHTGDIGVFDADGYLTLLGRKKDLIISGGINIAPAEVERIVLGFAGVTDCVAFGVPHERWGETVAVVVCGSVNLDELYRYVRQKLVNYAVPRYIGVSTGSLPRNAAGKVLRRTVAASFDMSAAIRTPAT